MEGRCVIMLLMFMWADRATRKRQGKTRRGGSPQLTPILPVTVFCEQTTHGSHLASFQVLSVTFSGCSFTDHPPPSPPHTVPGEQGTDDPRPANTEFAETPRGGWRYSHKVFPSSGFTWTAVRACLRVTNALVQPSGFEVIGNMQNWITFDFHT